MKNTICFLCSVILSSFLFLACSHKKTIKVERISNVKYYTVTNDIYPTLPGRLLYQDGKIFWEDALSSLLFMHMYDEKTGKELYSFANKGSGPEEFNRPTPTLLPDGGLMDNRSLRRWNKESADCCNGRHHRPGAFCLFVLSATVAVVLDSAGFYRSCLKHCTGIRCSQECKRNAERMDASARISESVSVLQRERTIQGVYGMEQSSDVVRE